MPSPGMQSALLSCRPDVLDGLPGSSRPRLLPDCRSSRSSLVTSFSTTATSHCSTDSGARPWCGSCRRVCGRHSTGMTLSASSSCASVRRTANGTGREPSRYGFRFRWVLIRPQMHAPMRSTALYCGPGHTLAHQIFNLPCPASKSGCEPDLLSLTCRLRMSETTA